MQYLLSEENKLAFVHNFFVATIVDNLFDNPVLFKNFEKAFLLISGRIIGTDVVVKDIINPCKCFLKNDNFTIKTTND